MMIIKRTRLRFCFIILFGLAANLAYAQTGSPVEMGAHKQPVDYVKPLAGTSNSRWMIFPGASMPFGMVKLSPDNQRRGWKAGYEYSIKNIAGFSHIHSWTMAGLLMMPATGPLYIKPGPPDNPDAGYRSRFSHKTEKASPGYYSVVLEDYDIKVELTATTRAGFQRYTFPESDSARILFDMQFPSEYGTELFAAKIFKVSDTAIKGYAYKQSLRGAHFNEYKIHFYMRFSEPFDTFSGWTRNGIQKDIKQIFSGFGHTDFGGYVTFNTEEGDVIKVQTGISFVSMEQAHKNLKEEIIEPFGWNFDAVRKHARKTWNKLLSKIEVVGIEENKTKFYTNMYRAYVGRTIFSDVNGKYVDMCEEVEQLEDPSDPIYGGDAFWNTFWNLNQLWTLVTPEIANDWVKSLLEIYDQGGWLPKGPTGIEYSGIMVASHEIPLMVSAYQKGIRNYDVEKMYKAIKHNQMVPGRPHKCGGNVGNQLLKSYMELGYVPYEKGPTSNTMEYAYDDYTVAQMAKALGKTGDYRYFMDRADNYRNVFNDSLGYVWMKKTDGTWADGFDRFCCSTFSGSGFVEGNAWQYSFFAPHDVGGLVALIGKEEFNRRLNKGFIKSSKYQFNAEQISYENSLHSMGLLPVNHGNQPNMQAAYLFNYSGKPWLTQKWARAIMNKYYGLGPKGAWPGDEDQGQMGAWFVMSAMGLFEMNGGTSTKPIYEIGSPIFEKMIIHLNKKYYPGEKFVIAAQNVSKENKYIQSATLDGEPLNKPWFYHKELVDGGKLVLVMGPEPNKEWGSGPRVAPPSMSDSLTGDFHIRPLSGTLPENVADFEKGHYEKFAPTYIGESEEWIRPTAQITAKNTIAGKYSLVWKADEDNQEWVLASNLFYLDKPFTLSAKIRVDATRGESFGLGIAVMETENKVAVLRLDENSVSLDEATWGDQEGGKENFDLKSGKVYTLKLSVSESKRIEALVLDGSGNVLLRLQGESNITPKAIGLYVSTPAGGESTLFFDDVSVESDSYSISAGTWVRAPHALMLPRPPEMPQEQGNWVGAMSVRKIDGKYWMWYRIRNNAVRGNGWGFARSEDGLHWHKYEGNPLFVPKEKYDSNEKMLVLKVNDRYQAWYSVDTGDSWATAYATSKDGIHWNRHGIVIEGYAKDPSVVYLGGTYYLYAIGPAKKEISVYTSTDGVEWERQNVLSMGAHRHPTAYYVDQEGEFRLYAFGGGKGVSIATSQDGIHFGSFKKIWSPPAIGLDDWQGWGIDYGAFATDGRGHLQQDNNRLMYYQARHAYGNNHGTWRYHGDGKVLLAGNFTDLFVGVPVTISPNKPYQYHAYPFPADRVAGVAVTSSAPAELIIYSWEPGLFQVGYGAVKTGEESAELRFSVTGLQPNTRYQMRFGDSIVEEKTTGTNGEATFIINLAPNETYLFDLMTNNF